MTVVKTSELENWAGKEVGVSDWVVVDQDRINAFADCTEDHQFIHVDEEKAKASPFGGTIAHGLLTLSLLPRLMEGVTLKLEGEKMGLNYGYDKVRFLAPLPSGSKVRGRHTFKSAVEKKPGNWLLTYDLVIEIEGGQAPALIATYLSMLIVD